MSETLRVPTRAERRRARRPVAAPMEAASNEGAFEAAASAEPNLVGVTADSGNVRRPGSTNGRTTLRAMLVKRLHPLALYLLERDVGIPRGAELLGVSERRLRDVLAPIEVLDACARDSESLAIGRQ